MPKTREENALTRKEAEMASLYLVTFNYDYNESAAVFRTRAEAVRAIADAFGLDGDDEGNPYPDQMLDTAEFWQDIMDLYENDDWKGFMVYKLDAETLEIDKSS